MDHSDSRGEPAAKRLLAWYDRTERWLKFALLVLLLALIVFQFMPFSPEIRDALSGMNRLEGEPYEPYES